MKIINLEQLNQMPDGTVFADCCNGYVDEVMIMTGHDRRHHKGVKKCFNGVYYLHPYFNSDDGFCDTIGVGVGDETPARWDTMDTSSTDYAREETPMFAVLSKDEVKELIGLLEDALKDGYEDNEYPIPENVASAAIDMKKDLVEACGKLTF